MPYVVSSACNAQLVIASTYDTKAQAKQENKLILLKFSGSDWCGPCIQLQKLIFDDPVFEQFAHDKLVLFKADFPRLKKNQLPKEQQAINDQLAETYNPEGEFPCMVLIDAQGNTLRKWHGYDKKHTVQDYIADVNAFINK
jgi:thioredoxin-related protein